MAVNLSLALPPEVVEAIAERAAEIVVERMLTQVPRGKYATVDEAAEFLRCDRQRIYDLRSSRVLTPFTEGGRALVSWEELEALVDVEFPIARRRRAA